MYDLGYLVKNHEVMIEHMERAIRLAGNAEQEERGEMLSISLYYCICYANFFKAINENDTDTLNELETYYQLILDILVKHRYSYQKLPTYFDLRIADNIWDEAYNAWLPVRNILPAGDSPSSLSPRSIFRKQRPQILPKHLRRKDK